MQEDGPQSMIIERDEEIAEEISRAGTDDNLRARYLKQFAQIYQQQISSQRRQIQQIRYQLDEEKTQFAIQSNNLNDKINEFQTLKKNLQIQKTQHDKIMHDINQEKARLDDYAKRWTKYSTQMQAKQTQMFQIERKHARLAISISKFNGSKPRQRQYDLDSIVQAFINRGKLLQQLQQELQKQNVQKTQQIKLITAERDSIDNNYQNSRQRSKELSVKLSGQIEQLKANKGAQIDAIVKQMQKDQSRITTQIKLANDKQQQKLRSRITQLQKDLYKVQVHLTQSNKLTKNLEQSRTKINEIQKQNRILQQEKQQHQRKLGQIIKENTKSMQQLATVRNNHQITLQNRKKQLEQQFKKQKTQLKKKVDANILALEKEQRYKNEQVKKYKQLQNQLRVDRQMVDVNGKSQYQRIQKQNKAFKAQLAMKAAQANQIFQIKLKQQNDRFQLKLKSKADQFKNQLNETKQNIQRQHKYAEAIWANKQAGYKLQLKGANDRYQQKIRQNAQQLLAIQTTNANLLKKESDQYLTIRSKLIQTHGSEMTKLSAQKIAEIKAINERHSLYKQTFEANLHASNKKFDVMIQQNKANQQRKKEQSEKDRRKLIQDHSTEMNKIINQRQKQKQTYDSYLKSLRQEHQANKKKNDEQYTRIIAENISYHRDENEKQGILHMQQIKKINQAHSVEIKKLTDQQISLKKNHELALKSLIAKNKVRQEEISANHAIQLQYKQEEVIKLRKSNQQQKLMLEQNHANELDIVNRNMRHMNSEHTSLLKKNEQRHIKEQDARQSQYDRLLKINSQQFNAEIANLKQTYNQKIQLLNKNIIGIGKQNEQKAIQHTRQIRKMQQSHKIQIANSQKQLKDALLKGIQIQQKLISDTHAGEIKLHSQYNAKITELQNYKKMLEEKIQQLQKNFQLRVYSSQNMVKIGMLELQILKIKDQAQEQLSFKTGIFQRQLKEKTNRIQQLQKQGSDKKQQLQTVRLELNKLALSKRATDQQNKQIISKLNEAAQLKSKLIKDLQTQKSQLKNDLLVAKTDISNKDSYIAQKNQQKGESVKKYVNLSNEFTKKSDQYTKYKIKMQEDLAKTRKQLFEKNIMYDQDMHRQSIKNTNLENTLLRKANQFIKKQTEFTKNTTTYTQQKQNLENELTKTRQQLSNKNKMYDQDTHYVSRANQNLKKQLRKNAIQFVKKQTEFQKKTTKYIQQKQNLENELTKTRQQLSNKNTMYNQDTYRVSKANQNLQKQLLKNATQFIQKQTEFQKKTTKYTQQKNNLENELTKTRQQLSNKNTMYNQDTYRVSKANQNLQKQLLKNATQFIQKQTEFQKKTANYTQQKNNLEDKLAKTRGQLSNMKTIYDIDMHRQSTKYKNLENTLLMKANQFIKKQTEFQKKTSTYTQQKLNLQNELAKTREQLSNKNTLYEQDVGILRTQRQKQSKSNLESANKQIKQKQKFQKEINNLNKRQLNYTNQLAQLKMAVRTKQRMQEKLQKSIIQVRKQLFNATKQNQIKARLVNQIKLENQKLINQLQQMGKRNKKKKSRAINPSNSNDLIDQDENNTGKLQQLAQEVEQKKEEAQQGLAAQTFIQPSIDNTGRPIALQTQLNVSQMQEKYLAILEQNNDLQQKIAQVVKEHDNAHNTFLANHHVMTEQQHMKYTEFLQTADANITKLTKSFQALKEVQHQSLDNFQSQMNTLFSFAKKQNAIPLRRQQTTNLPKKEIKTQKITVDQDDKPDDGPLAGFGETLAKWGKKAYAWTTSNFQTKDTASVLSEAQYAALIAADNIVTLTQGQVITWPSYKSYLYVRKQNKDMTNVQLLQTYANVKDETGQAVDPRFWQTFNMGGSTRTQNLLMKSGRTKLMKAYTDAQSDQDFDQWVKSRLTREQRTSKAAKKKTTVKAAGIAKTQDKKQVTGGSKYDEDDQAEQIRNASRVKLGLASTVADTAKIRQMDQQTQRRLSAYGYY